MSATVTEPVVQAVGLAQRIAKGDLTQPMRAHGKHDLSARTESQASVIEEPSASSRIADIIGIIDGMAFQTNILALNAAVEAAKAIKRLISDSVQRVERGTSLVEEMTAAPSADGNVFELPRRRMMLAGRCLIT